MSKYDELLTALGSAVLCRGDECRDKSDRGGCICTMAKNAIEELEAKLDHLSDKLELERALTDGAHRRAGKAEAKLAKAVEALSLTRRADDLREAYHRLPNDKNRIGDKKSKKSRARDAWLRAFRKAAKEARAIPIKEKDDE